MSHLFVFRTYPDIDHMVPAVWKLLESGEEVHAVVSPGYDARSDHRLRFVSRYPGFHLYHVDLPASGWRSAVRNPLRRTIFWAMWILLRHQVDVVCVEWGFGFDRGYERPRSLAGLRAVARSFARSLTRARRSDAHETRVNFLVAARLLQRKTVCLPHGLNIKLDPATNGELRDKIASGTLDWSDRNRFAVYVLNTEHHRRFHLRHAGGDPDVMQTWGSLRWSPAWFELNRSLAPSFQWPDDAGGRLKVVFMVPKWKNRVRADEVVALVRRLHELPFVSLALKGHPRPEDGSVDPLRGSPVIDWTRIHDVSAVDSVALLNASDVAIDVGSSIGLEVVMQGKVLINPTYIHELKTLFDDIPGSSVVAHHCDEVVEALEQIDAGRPLTAQPAAVTELMRRAVYGERDAPFDVPAYYAKRLQALAAQPRS